MHEPNVQRLMQIIQPGWQVLDIGGWACPFNRATHVMDAEAYATRGYYAKIGKPAFQGPAQEHFTASTWIQRDICGRQPYPFKDKELDYVTCSHTLEDIRDPLWVCSEMVRVAKRGYVEIPSRMWETCRGTEHPRLAGLSHHRWLIEVSGNHISFLPKFHMIHRDPAFNFPPATLGRMKEEDAIAYLFWDGEFTFAERTIHGTDAMAAELVRYAGEHAALAGSQSFHCGWIRFLDQLNLQCQRGQRALRRITGG